MIKELGFFPLYLNFHAENRKTGNMEEFKDIAGYEGLYKISSKGNVLSLITMRILKSKTNKDRWCDSIHCN